jgi:hypothetical protein
MVTHPKGKKLRILEFWCGLGHIKKACPGDYALLKIEIESKRGIYQRRAPVIEPQKKARPALIRVLIVPETNFWKRPHQLMPSLLSRTSVC